MDYDYNLYKYNNNVQTILPQSRNLKETWMKTFLLAACGKVWGVRQEHLL
jgi:hypothetical protein